MWWKGLTLWCSLFLSSCVSLGWTHLEKYCGLMYFCIWSNKFSLKAPRKSSPGFSSASRPKVSQTDQPDCCWDGCCKLSYWSINASVDAVTMLHDQQGSQCEGRSHTGCLNSIWPSQNKHHVSVTCHDGQCWVGVILLLTSIRDGHSTDMSAYSSGGGKMSVSGCSKSMSGLKLSSGLWRQ